MVEPVSLDKVAMVAALREDLQTETAVAVEVKTPPEQMEVHQPEPLEMVAQDYHPLFPALL
jgi:hypothetical protein